MLGPLSGFQQHEVWALVPSRKFRLGTNFLGSVTHFPPLLFMPGEEPGVESPLFLAYITPLGGASPDTVSHWLVQSISFNGLAFSGPGTLRAHDIHALAASWAFCKGVPLSVIVRGCHQTQYLVGLCR